MYFCFCVAVELDEDEHILACLLMVFIAVSIPKLARSEGSFYKASLEGHANNIHCMASAVNNIFGALFTICGQGDIEDRMKEFLAVSLLISLEIIFGWKQKVIVKKKEISHTKFPYCF